MGLFWKRIQRLTLSETDVRELNAALSSLNFIEETARQNLKAESTPTELVTAYNYAAKKLDRLSRKLLKSRQFYEDAVPIGNFLFHIQNYRLLAQGFFHDELVLSQARWILEHISDEQLQQRCRDLLLAERDFDRAVSQATLVLEDRLREKLATDRSLYGKALVEDVMPEAFERARFRISSIKSEYFGYKKIIMGIFQAHRNPSHHGIQNMNRIDAARICAYIDMLLAAIESAARQDGQPTLDETS